MKRLLFIELGRVVPTFALLYFLSILAFYFFDISFLLLLIPAGSVLVSSSVLKRSSWYLGLPWSRAKIFWAVFAHSLIVFLANCGLIALIFSVEGKLFFGENSEFYRKFAFVGYLVSFVFSFYRSLLGIQLRKQVLWSDFFGKKFLITMAIIGLCLIVIWKSDLFSEPTFLVLIAVNTVYGLFRGIYHEFVIPESSAKTLKRFTAISAASLYVIILGAAIVAVNWDVARKDYTTFAAGFLGRFPSFISEQRALSLFINTDMSSNASMLRHLGFLQDKITNEEWKSRTLSCHSSNCLELSAEVSKTDTLSSKEIEDRFLILMSFCDFQLDESGRNTCIKRLKMDKEHTKSWLTLLEQKGTLREWLLSEDSKKQIIALKGMSYTINAEQERLISSLGQSSDARIKTAATLFLQNSQTYKSQGLNCNSNKDDRHPVCRFKEKEYEM